MLHLLFVNGALLAADSDHSLQKMYRQAQYWMHYSIHY